MLKVCRLAENWVVEISQRKGKTEAEARVLGCKVFTFGSYRLGVHGQGEGRGMEGGWGSGMEGGWGRGVYAILSCCNCYV